MRTGELNRRITLESEVTESRDTYGGVSKAWEIQDTVWAKVKFLSGKESEVADKITSLQMTEFSIRWRSDISPTGAWRIRYDGRVYNIKGIYEVGQRDVLVLTGEVENI